MIKKILSADYLKRLDNIKQWQERDTFKEESVSQHSYKVTIFARILLEDIFKIENEEIIKFKLDVVTLAMFHDWDEALILRDLSHDTKYNEFNGDKIREQLDNLSHHLSEKEFGEGELISNQLECPDKLVKAFVKFCDWLALQYFVKREISLGNKNFELTLKYCRENLEKAEDKLFISLNNKFSNAVLRNE